MFRPPSRPSHVAPRSAASQQKQCNKCRAQGRRVMKQLRRKQWIGVLAFLVEGTSAWADPRSSTRSISDTPRATAEEQFARSEEHTSELQSLMRISYAVFCLKKKKKHHNEHK